MRLRFLIPGVLLLALLAGGGVVAHAASDRQSTFTGAAAALRTQWDADQAQGVPAIALASLRHELDQQAPGAAWWSPAWLHDDGQALLTRLRSATASTWKAELDRQRIAAEAVMAGWSSFTTEQAAWLDPAVAGAAAQWAQELAAASSPSAIAHLASTWQATLGAQQTAVQSAQAAQKAKLDGELSGAGGPQALLATAQRLLGVAGSANLDAGNVASLASALQTRLDGRGDAVAIADQLLAAVDKLQALIALNNQVASQLQPLQWMVDQAKAEGTPSAATFAAQDATVATQMRAARTTDELNAVTTAAAGLNSTVSAELDAHQCGYAVGSGKVVTINLTLQEMLFYQDGCVVKATPITSGRPALPTPTGTFHIFYKTTPFTMVSPWPKGSPYYYYPTVVSWVMEFAGGGYFIHDAYWESTGSYGPGGELNPVAASHGCVHVPTSTMQWAYSWTPMGTPVVISA